MPSPNVSVSDQGAKSVAEVMVEIREAIDTKAKGRKKGIFSLVRDVFKVGNAAPLAPKPQQ